MNKVSNRVQIRIYMKSSEELAITSPSGIVTRILGSKGVSRALRSLGINSIPLCREQTYEILESTWERANRGSLQ